MGWFMKRIADIDSFDELNFFFFEFVTDRNMEFTIWESHVVLNGCKRFFTKRQAYLQVLVSKCAG